MIDKTDVLAALARLQGAEADIKTISDWIDGNDPENVRRLEKQRIIDGLIDLADQEPNIDDGQELVDISYLIKADFDPERAGELCADDGEIGLRRMTEAAFSYNR